MAYVDLQIFDAVPEGITVEKLAGLAGSLTLHAHVEAELAHIDSAADRSLAPHPAGRAGDPDAGHPRHPDPDGDQQMSATADRLYELLPVVHRLRDAERGLSAARAARR